MICQYYFCTLRKLLFAFSRIAITWYQNRYYSLGRKFFFVESSSKPVERKSSISACSEKWPLTVGLVHQLNIPRRTIKHVEISFEWKIRNEIILWKSGIIKKHVKLASGNGPAMSLEEQGASGALFARIGKRSGTCWRL